MAQNYSDGKKAWGQCARTGKRMLLKDMVPDGRFPGLLVDPAAWEDKHPQETLKPLPPEPQAVRRPAPDRDRPVSVVTFPGYDLVTGATYTGFYSLDGVSAVTTNILETGYLFGASDGDDLITNTNDDLIFYTP